MNIFKENGFTLIENVLNNSEYDDLDANILNIGNESIGTRNILIEPWCAYLGNKIRTHPDISNILPSEYKAVQCTYFEKSQDKNWLVSLHQDLSIPVAERIEHAELKGWSTKEGILYVQATPYILEQLIAIRIHLDICGYEDGALKVIPGSHQFGIISPEVSQSIRKTTQEILCTAERGTALVMHPLLLHASSKATGQSRRRVLHFLFGPKDLPYGLHWQQV